MSQRPLTPTGPPGPLGPRSRKTATIEDMAVGATPMPGMPRSPSRLRADDARPRLEGMPPPRESVTRRRAPRGDEGTDDGMGTNGSVGSRSRSPSQSLSPARDLEPSPGRRGPPVPGLMAGEYALPASSPVSAGSKSLVLRSTNEASGHGQLSARLGHPTEGTSPGTSARSPPERSQAQIWAGPMGTAPVTIGMASSIRTFLKGLDVAGACCVGALLGAQSGPADFFKPHIHYSMHKQAYMMPLPNSYLPSMDHVELLNPHVAAVSLPPATMGEEATGSPVVDAFLRDIPALQGFLRRFMSDANFVPPELRLRKRKAVAPEDYLQTHHYMLDMHREGIGINMYLKRPLPRYPLQQAGGWPYGRTKRQAPDASPNRIVDTYLLKPSFCGGTELLCQIAYQDPNARERDGRGGRRGREDGEGDGGAVNEIQGVMTRKTALPLSCSVDEVVALIQGNLDQMIVPVSDLTCFQAIIMSLCGLPQVRDEEASTEAEANTTKDEASTNSQALVLTARSTQHTTGSSDTDAGPTAGLGLLEPGMAFTNSVMLQRLVQSRTFTRLLWRAIRRRHAAEADTDLEAWRLRCLLLPSEVKLLRAVARDEPKLTPELLVEELRCVSHAIQAAPTARANALEGLCTTLWEELDGDPSNGPLLTSVRRLVKHVPAFLESCIHGRGVMHAAALWWKAGGGGEGYAYLHRLCKAANEVRPMPRASFRAISEFDMVEFTAVFDLPEEEEDEPPPESSDDETQPDELLGSGEGGERLGSGLRRHTSDGDDTPTGRGSALSARLSAASARSAGSDVGGGRPHPPMLGLIMQGSASNFILAPPEPQGQGQGQGDGQQLSAREEGPTGGGGGQAGGELAKSVYKAKNVYPVKPLRRLGPGGLSLLGGSSNCVVPGVALPTERGPLASGRQSQSASSSLSARLLPGTSSRSSTGGGGGGGPTTGGGAGPAMSELRVSELHRMGSGKHLLQHEGGVVVSSHRSSVGQTSRSSLSEDTELAKADTPMGRGSEGSGTARGSGSSQRDRDTAREREREHGLPPTGREHTAPQTAREGHGGGGGGSGPGTARNSEVSPHTARGSGLVVGPMGRRVPKLSIKPITQAAAGGGEEPNNASARVSARVSARAGAGAAAGGAGAGAPFASSRAPLSAGASPLYTTRSSRRHAAVSRGTSATSNQQRGRSASSAFIYSSSQQGGAKGQGQGPLNNNGATPSSRGLSLGESMGRAQTYLLRGTGAPIEVEQLDVTQVKFHLLAKKVGQSYVASDLWALMETQRREGRAHPPGPTPSAADRGPITSARSPSSRALLSAMSGVSDDPFASTGLRSTSGLDSSSNSPTPDHPRSNNNNNSRPVLQSMGSRRALFPPNDGGPTVTADRRRSAALEPHLAFWVPDECSVLHWPAAETEAHRVLRGGDTDKGDPSASLPALPLDGSQKGSDPPLPGGPSQNLKLLRDLCLNLAQFPHADTMGDLEEVALVLVDEMLSGLRTGSVGGGRNRRLELLNSMYEVVLTQSTAAIPDVELPSAMGMGLGEDLLVGPSPLDGPSPLSSSEKGLGLPLLEQGPQHIPPTTQEGLGGTHGSVGSLTGTGTGTVGMTGGGGLGTKRTAGDEPIVSQIQSRLRRLSDVTDALAQCLLHGSCNNNNGGGLFGEGGGTGTAAAAGGGNNGIIGNGNSGTQPVSAVLRARLCLLQRWAACDRLALAKLLFKHMTKALARGRLTWPLIARVVELCRRCVTQLKLSDPHARAKFPTQGGALLLEEAGFLFWILRTVDLLCDACCRHPSACLQLVGVLHDYIEAVREALASLLFYLHLPPRLDTLVCNALGAGAKEWAFCTPAALARIRLAALSHINRCIDLCRSSMRWHSREIDGTGAKATDAEHKAKLQQIVSDFHKLNLFLNSDLVHRVASVTTDHSGLRSARMLSDPTNTDDPRLTVGFLWALGKVVSMEDERHLQRRDWADQAVFHHFTALIKNYAAAWDPHKRLLCKLHLRVLLSLVLYRHPSVLSKCFQLRVLHFFVHEISSELRCGMSASSIPPSSSSASSAPAPRPDGKMPTEAMTLPARNADAVSQSLPSVGSLKNFGQTLTLSSTQRLRSPKDAATPPSAVSPRSDNNNPKPTTPSPFKTPLTSPKQVGKPSLPSTASSPRRPNNPLPSLATPAPKKALPPMSMPQMAVPQQAASPITTPLISSPPDHSAQRRLSSSAPLAPTQSPPPSASIEPLTIGDRVDGLVTLKSGRQRWFPGHISSVSLSPSESPLSNEVRYGVTYDDGDVESDKPPSDVRQSRSQRRPQPGDNAGGSSSNGGDNGLRRVQSASAIAPPTLPGGPTRPTTSLTPSALQVPRPKLTLPAMSDRPAADKQPPPSTPSDPSTKPPAPNNLRVAIPTAAGSITPIARSPNPVVSPSPSPDSCAAKKELGLALQGATSLPDPSEHGSSEEEDEDEEEDDDVFDIPSLLPGADRREKMLSIALAIPVAGFGLSRETAGQLGGSLSASLLYTDAEAAAENLNNLNNLKSGGPSSTVAPGPPSERASSAAGISGVASAREASLAPSTEPPSAKQPALDYGEQRKAITLYLDAQLQELVLLLVLNLCVSTDRVTLESRYCSQLPFSNGNGSESVGFNVLYALYCHLSHPENARVVPRLRSHVAQFGKAASRLFKLVCEGIFDMRLYSHGQEILAKGAFGTVMSVKSPVNLTDGVPDSDRSVSHDDSSLTVKLIPHEVSAQDRCVTFDVFSEVAALETLAHSPYVCRLYDYGISGGKFWLVMERCRSSLKAWRTEQMPAKPSDKDIVLYLHVFSKILEGVQALHHEGIAHFDLKCDNIFIREREGPEPKDTRFHVPFRVCIGDFGEAQMGSARNEDNESDVEDDEADRRILQGRGTEAIQSPEMLLIGAKNRKDAAGYDRRKRVTVGCASDVWSLGCLLYELLTGDFLFVYTVWAEFFVQLTSSTSRVLPSERMAPLRESLSPEVFSMVERLLEYMLVRSADRRPRVDMVRRQLQLVVQALSKKIGLPTTQTPYRRRPLVPPKTDPAPTLKGPPKLVAQDSFTSRLAAMGGLDNMWLPHVSGHESYREGLWRLSTDVYVGCVAKWENFLQPGHNFHELMGEVDPNETTSLPPVSRDEPVMCFSAAFLPDLWTERQWLLTQRVPAYHLGITRVLFVTEASSSYHHPNTPLLSVVEKDLKDVEVMISLQKNIRLTVGATGGTGGGHRSRPSSQHGGGKSAAGQAPGTQNFGHSRTPVSILQINSRTDGTTTHEQLAKLLQDNSTTLDRVADFMLCRDHRTRGCSVIVTSASDQSSSLPHVLASTVAAMCSIRAPDAPPTLYECLMRAKGAYPRLALTPHFVEVLQHIFQRDSNINVSKNNRA